MYQHGLREAQALDVLFASFWLSAGGTLAVVKVEKLRIGHGLPIAFALAVLIVKGNDIIPAIVRSALLPLVRRLNELE